MDSAKTTLYIPNQRAKTGIFKVWLIMFRNIISSKELIWQLFRRDFLMAYKKSFLGMTWIFIAPIIGILSWVLMNATGILSPGDVGVPYPAYVLISSSIWGLFMGFFDSSAGTLTAGTGFIMQVKFPHEALLVKQTAQQLANFLLSFVLSILIILIFGIVPSWKIVFFPLIILPMFFMAAGIGLIVSVINVVALDFSKGFHFIMGLLMYITPVIYSRDVDNELLQSIIDYNPLTYLIGNARDLILFGSFENPDRYIYSCLLAIMIFLLSLRLFYISEGKVIEKMV